MLTKKFRKIDLTKTKGDRIMKTKNALIGIMLLVLAILVTNVMFADDKKKSGKKENLPVAKKNNTPIEKPHYEIDAAEDFNYLSEDPGIDDLTNYPEPFMSSTTILYNLNRTGYVNLKIYYPGRTRSIEVFARSLQKEGSHIVEFNANGLPPGEYFCELIFEGQVVYESMLKKAPTHQKSYLEN